MKGKWPQEELERAAAPAGEIADSRDVHVPGLGEERCVIVLHR